MANQKLYKISKKDLFDLLERLSQEASVYVPYKNGEHLQFDPFDPAREDAIELGGIRQSQPFKSFLNHTRESVFKIPKETSKQVAVIGVKACDLSSLVLQDYVFLQGGIEDPFYAGTRKNTLIISCDCTYAKETCFCVAMEGRPYPTKYFDINLSALGDDFIVEPLSQKGEGLIDKFGPFFKTIAGKDAEKRDTQREKVSSEVKGYISKRSTPEAKEIAGMVAKNYNLSELWKDASSTCVECGACNLVCPTCHCFLIYDEKRESKDERYRIWDSCLYKTFARVAGGANPRKHLYERMRNRFDKKFDFFPKVLNYTACTGCGRCIEACPGDIDIREVLKGLVSGKWEKPPHK